MSLARLQSRAPNGLDAPPVLVEIHLSGGLPSFTIVGLPEAAVRESRERVRSALINSGFDFPARRITANLAPADIPKQGGRFDLPIALGILAASGQIKPAGGDLPGDRPRHAPDAVVIPPASRDIGQRLTSEQFKQKCSRNTQSKVPDAIYL